MANEWFYMQGAEQCGPVSSDDLRGLATSGALVPSSLIWQQGMADWIQASTYDGLFAQAPNPTGPPPLPAARLQTRAFPPQGTAGQGTVLEKCYMPFQITLIVIFGLGMFTLGVSYFYGPFLIAIGFAVCNFIAGMDNRLGTSPWDLVIMILAAVSLIPLLGWITQMLAMAFSIVALVKYLNYRAGSAGGRY